MSDSKKENEKSSDVNKPLFAAVKFFVDKSKKIHYVPVHDIKGFIFNDFTKPKQVKYGVNALGEIIFEPAQILAVADSVTSLDTSEKRYKFWNMRRSDAISLLAGEKLVISSEEDDVEQVKTNKSAKPKPIRKQSNLSTTISSDNVSAKLSAINMQPLNTEHLTNANRNQNQMDEKDKLILELQKQIKCLQDAQEAYKRESGTPFTLTNTLDAKISPCKMKSTLTKNVSLLSPNVIPLVIHSQVLNSDREAKDSPTRMTLRTENLNMTSRVTIYSPRGSLSKFRSPNAETKSSLRMDHSISSPVCNSPTLKLSQVNVRNREAMNTPSTSFSNIMRQEDGKQSALDHSISSPVCNSPTLKLSQVNVSNREAMNTPSTSFSNIMGQEDGKQSALEYTPTGRFKRDQVNIPRNRSEFSSTTSASSLKVLQTEECSSPGADEPVESSDCGIESSEDSSDSPVPIKRRKKARKGAVKKKIFDPEEYENSADKKECKTVWYKDVAGISKPVKMMHLYYGVSVTYDCYKSARDQKTNSLFTRELATGIWGRNVLKSKALNPRSASCELRGETSRDPLSPDKEATLAKCYEDRLKQTGLLPTITDEMRETNMALVEELETKSKAKKMLYRQDLRFFINSLRSTEKRKELNFDKEERRKRKMEKKKNKKQTEY